MVCTCSGSFGPVIVPITDVYKSWVDSVNGSGGINGHPIDLIVKDDGGVPGTSDTDIQSLISQHVDAIVDMTIADETWASTIQAANIPVVGIDVTETPFYTNPDFYPEGQTNDAVVYANVEVAKASGAKNLGDLYCAEAASCAEGAALYKTAGTKQGLPVIYNGEIAATAPNYTAQCLAAQQAHVQAVFIGDSQVIVSRVAADCARQGYTPTYITDGEGYSTILQTTPGIKDTLWSSYNDIPFYADTPSIQQMNAAIDKYYPGMRSNGNEFSELAAYSWPSGLLLQDAVKAGGLGPSDTPSAAEVVKGLEALKGDTLQGWAPPLTFAPGKPHPVDCWFVGRLQNGVPSVLNNGQVSCEPGTSS